MKIPLKNNFFVWYLRRGVILTKDNLIKRNWHGSKSCVFCSHDETIKHSCFSNATLHVLYGQSSKQLQACIHQLVLPMSFENWVHGIDNKYIILLKVGAIELIWSLWLCRNDKDFDNKNSSIECQRAKHV
jgi:hypothetical protein